MLQFYGKAYDKNDIAYEIKIKAKSEAEAVKKVKAKYRNRRKKIILRTVDLEYVEFA